MKQKVALITGITGQDGAYLSDFLLDKNYIVYGLQQISTTPNTQNIEHLLNHKNFHLIQGDMVDAHNITNIITKTKPDEIYNLAGQSHVGLSFDVPDYTTQVNALGTLRILETIRMLDLNTKFYQASSSEIFGNAPKPQNEETSLTPCSPYAAAKAYAHNITKIYRDAYDIYACNGILFNHESPIRGEEFVTQKIISAVKSIRDGKDRILTLGNLNAQRDWGHAKDYVRGMWLMMQQNTSDDYVLATGQSYSVREFVEKSFTHIDITIEWKEDGLDEIGIDKATGKTLVTIDEKFYRPNELHTLIGDATKAKQQLNWQPEISIDDLIKDMIEN